jgi:hypothetical protein
MMCGIDEAIRHIQNNCRGFAWEGLVIERLDYHRKQATGEKPKLNKGNSIKDYYTCGNCGHILRINDNFCPGCGYRIKWDTVRCLTGLPLVDAAER